MTYMKEVYKRKTRCINQLVTLQLNNKTYFGEESEFELYQEGDLINSAWIVLTFPGGTSTVCESFGTYMINWVQLEYDGQVIERLYGEYLDILNDLTISQGKQSALKSLVGKGLTTPLSKYTIKLPFDLFNKGFPVCALKKNPVIRLNIRNFSECGTGITINPLFNAVIVVDYIFLEEDARSFFVKSPLNYLIEQTQHFSTTVSPDLNYKTYNFNLPTITLIGTFKTVTSYNNILSTQPISQLLLVLNTPPYGVPVGSIASGLPVTGAVTVVSINGPQVLVSFTSQLVGVINSGTSVSFNKNSFSFNAPLDLISFKTATLANLPAGTTLLVNNIGSTLTSLGKFVNTIIFTWSSPVTTVNLKLSGTYLGKSDTPATIYTNFTNSCKEMFMVLQLPLSVQYDYTLDGTNDILSSMRLCINDAEYIKYETGTKSLLNIVGALDKHTRSPDRLFYMYSFGIDPENDKYTGSIHMGKQQFDLRFNPCSFSINVRVYMRSFNIMEIRGGNLRVLYPCPVYIENIFNSKIISTKTSATGGTVTNVGLKKIHTFNSSGTFTVSQGGQAEVLVVGGGGGGGGSYIDYSTTNLNNFSYGGGAGGVVYKTAYNLTQGTYNVIIGSGGSGGTGSNFTKIFSGNPTSFSVTPVHKTITGARTGGGTINIYNGSVGTNGNKYYYYFNSTSNPGGNGANSSFGDITAIGGGGGGTGSFVSINTYAAQTGGTGGSGGGNGGIGTTGQGNNAWTSGGGGAGASGTPVSYSISGTAAFYGGGGTNGNIPSIPSTDTQILTGLVDPKTIAFNPAGLAVFPTLFSYCDQTNVNVRAKAFIETTIADVPTLTGIERVVSDNTGILYGSEATQNSIFKISPSGASLFASGFTSLYTLLTIPFGAGLTYLSVVSSTTDSNRNLYIIDNGTTIYKITPSGTKTTFSSGFTNAVGLVADSTNNIYVIDGKSIFKITQASVMTTITSGGITYTGASHITIDVNSNLYVSSVFRTTILKITQAGVVTTFTTMPGDVKDITIDSSGNMYILINDTGITLINIATPSTTYKFPDITITLKSLQAGPSNLLYGAVNDYVKSIFSVISMSTVNFTDKIVTTQTSSMNLTGIVSDSSGRLYIMQETIVFKITISNLVINNDSPSASVVITVFATGFTNLKGIVADSSGNLYVSDGNQIKKITLSGTVSIFAGSTSSGFTNGSGTNARFNNPWGLAVDSSDNIYVADSVNNVIRMITPSGTVSTFAGTGAAGNIDGDATTVATFNGPKFVTFYSSYGLIVGDTGNSLLRLINSGLTRSYDLTNRGGEISTVLGGGQIYTINSEGTVCTYTLSPSVTSGILNVGMSSITSYYLSVDFPSPPTGYCADSTFVYASCGPPNSLVLQYITDPRVRSYDLQIIGISQDIYRGLAFDSNGNIYCSDSNNQITKNVQFYAKGFTSPRAIVVDPSGNLFIADTSSIKKVDTSGVVTTFTTTNISQAQGIDRDSSGNIYITDTGTNNIKKYNSSGTLIQTYTANLNNPQGLIVDTNGNIYVADKGNNVIKLITPSGSVAILPVTTFSPQDVTLDPSGTLYYVDSLNACQVTNKITTTSSTGAITIPNNTGTGAVLNGNTNNAPSIAGTANTGGGGGGAVSIYPNGSDGGSGVVIVSYPQ